MRPGTLIKTFIRGLFIVTNNKHPGKVSWLVFISRHFLASNYMFKVNNRDIGKRCGNISKVNNKDTRTTPMASFLCLYC